MIWINEEEFQKERKKYQDYFEVMTYEEWLKTTPENQYGLKFGF